MDKKTEQLLGIIIGIVSLVVSVAALAISLPEHGATAGIAASGGLFGLAIGGWVVRHARSLPPFSLKHVKLTFQITHPDGSQCLTSKEVRFRCNYSEQTRFIQRNIYADGEVKDFRWVGDGVLDGVAKKAAGEHRVTILYEPSWPYDKDCHGTLSYSVSDTFPDSTEWVAYACDRSATGAAEIEVQFPTERACKKTWACQQSMAGEVKHLETPKVLDQATKVVLTVKRPKPGYEYYVYWEW